MLRLVLLASLAVSAFAQSISQPCLTALGQVAANADASSCLNIPAFVQFLNTPPASSIVQPFNTWLSGLCGKPACSDATLTFITTTVGPACTTEIQALGFKDFAKEFKSGYPVFRKTVCLKHGDTLCLTEFLTQVEKTSGSTLTLTNALKLLTNPSTLPKEITCTNCSKAAFNILAQASPTDANAAKPALQQQCGAAFVDGQNPSDISQGAA